jgi:hypothetical protein
MEGVVKNRLVAVFFAAVVLVSGTVSSFAGAVGGAKFANETVLARATDSYTISFRAGELARVDVLGDSDTDLDLYVYDQFGNLIASDADYTDRCAVTWVPRWTGVFTIRVVNRGGVYNAYRIQTN